MRVGQADVGVAGGIVALVALGLDDRAAAAVVEERGSRSARGRRRGPSGRRNRRSSRRSGASGAAALTSALRATRALTAASVSRAASICSASGAEPVPPSIRFDSSQLLALAAPRRRSRRGARSARRSSSGVSSESDLPCSTASRTRPPTIPCASRNGTPLRTSRSATSVAASISSPEASSSRSRSKLDPGQHPLGRVEAGLDRVDRVEERLLVLLHVLAVGERQGVHRPRAARRSRRRPAGSWRAAARPSRGSPSAA